jgi:hypothetical protein
MMSHIKTLLFHNENQIDLKNSMKKQNLEFKNEENNTENLLLVTNQKLKKKKLQEVKQIKLLLKRILNFQKEHINQKRKNNS